MTTLRRLVRDVGISAALLAAPLAASAQPAAADAVRPFTIRIPDAALTDLKARLANARIPEPLQGDGWTHGTDIRYLRQLVAYWRKGFDWRAQERKLNQFEQFTTTIDGLTVHFIHRRSEHPNALPLLVTHGWPGSIVEFTKVIGPLTDPEAHGGTAADAFHVVMPSIPGFAFSQAPKEPGYDPARIATLEAKLMARLGYTRYGVQGGDWGSIISISLYWLTQTAASSARIYYESRHTPPSATAGRRIEVPTACADFPKEIIWSPRRWLEGHYNITRWTEMPRGGHFAAFEQPQLLVADVRAFFATLR